MVQKDRWVLNSDRVEMACILIFSCITLAETISWWRRGGNLIPEEIIVIIIIVIIIIIIIALKGAI